jgi:hypothetical protein
MFYSSNMPLFGKSHKSPGEIVRNLREALLLIEKGQERKSEKAVEEVFNFNDFVAVVQVYFLLHFEFRNHMFLIFQTFI